MNNSRRTLFWSTCAVVSGICAVCLYLNWPRWQPDGREQPIQVSRQFLELKDGRLRRLGKDAAFSGLMVELYPTGKIMSRSEIVNGQLNGVSEGWFPDGTLQVHEHFQSGISHGLRIKWHPNGAKLSEAQIAQGKFEGTFRQWYENGALAQEIDMKDGKPDGRACAFYESGFLKSEAQMNTGKVISQKSWADGQSKFVPDDRNDAQRGSFVTHGE
jgi:antitoxin component YwqK of YwqJK toxin-antitoxin module